jgi:antibiotic biosynthesis monooxygenase (ABM) superfamily enzyme
MPCFASDIDYEALLDQIELCSRLFPGWTYTEIVGMTARERANWIERGLARQQRK